MTVLLEGAFSMVREELVTETARAFGFARVTQAVRDRFEMAVDAGIADDRLREDSGRITLP